MRQNLRWVTTLTSPTNLPGHPKGREERWTKRFVISSFNHSHILYIISLVACVCLSVEVLKPKKSWRTVGSSISWTNFAIEVSNSKSRNGIYQFGYTLTTFGFWTVEPGFDILRTNRGPEIAIEALNKHGRIVSDRHGYPLVKKITRGKCIHEHLFGLADSARG